MIVANGITTESLEFNTPSDFSNCLTGFSTCVFHPSGGGATYAPASVDVTTGTSPQRWVFNGENEINLVGTTAGGDAPTADTAEIIAFLPNLKEAICRKVNEELGISGSIPVETNIDVTTEMINTNGTAGGSTGLVSGASGGTIGDTPATLDGQAFGCFAQGGINYYFHALIEQ
jgi:hypothetical protein